MRVNVYSQEITSEVDLITKRGGVGETYSAIMFPLHSSERLHDDDKSGVTFWLPKSAARREALAQTFERAAAMVRMAPEEDHGMFE